MKLAVLMPVYNEERLLATVVEHVLATPPPATHDGTPLARSLYLVDDGSSDGTGRIAESMRSRGGAGIHVIRHERNQGKGAAIRTALTAALADGADIFIIHDSDLEYDPRDHARVLAPIIDGRADAVIGSRFLGETHRVLYYWHAVANRFITTFSNMLSNLNLTDIECCLKAFTREIAEKVTLNENRFGLEPEMIARIARAKTNVRVYEVAVSYAGRTYAEGKKIGWKDGVSALRCIIRYNLFP